MTGGLPAVSGGGGSLFTDGRSHQCNQPRRPTPAPAAAAGHRSAQPGQRSQQGSAGVSGGHAVDQRWKGRGREVDGWRTDVGRAEEEKWTVVDGLMLEHVRIQ